MEAMPVHGHYVIGQNQSASGMQQLYCDLLHVCASIVCILLIYHIIIVTVRDRSNAHTHAVTHNIVYSTLLYRALVNTGYTIFL